MQHHKKFLLDVEDLGNPSSKRMLPYILLFLCIFLVYSNSFNCSWQFDDITNIVNNRGLHLKELSLLDLRQSIHADPGGPSRLYRPVASLTFALNHSIGGLDVLGYHVVNLSIHMIASLFLFLFIRNTLHLPGLKGQYGFHSNSIALLAAVCWAVHPIQVQAVTYLVQRMTSLAGMFFIMGMYFYLGFRTAATLGKKILLSGLCITAYLMGFGSKENAALLPLSLLLYEFMLIQEDRKVWFRKHYGKMICVLIALAILGVLYLHLRKGGILLSLDEYEARPFSLIQRLLSETRVLVFYLSLLIYPVPWRLSVAHSMQVSTSPFDPLTTIVSILFLTGVLVVLLLLAKDRPLISFSFLFFFVNHLLESTLLPLELIFEHRNYIPSMMCFLPIALTFFWLLKRYEKNKIMRYVVSGGIAFLIMGVGYSTFLRNLAWKTPTTLWMDALQKAPDQLRVHHNLGIYYQGRGLRQLAMVHYEQALKSPVLHRRDEAVATYYQLGLLNGEMGNFDMAKHFYNEALRMKPDFPPALVNLASIHDHVGEKAQADHYLLRALDSDPSNGHANLNAGMRYLRLGMPEAAIYHFHIATKDKNLGGNAFLYLGIAYKQKGLFGAALLHLRKALDMDRRNITPRLHLMAVCLAIGMEGEAQREAEIVADIITQNPGLLQLALNLSATEKGFLPTQPSTALVTPLLFKALEEKTRNLDSLKEEIKKIMEKEMQIR